MIILLDTPTHKIEIPDGSTTSAPPVRVISTDSFIDRIPLTAYNTIANHANADAKAFMSALNSRDTIDLDNDKTIYYIDRMVTATLITQAEADVILADGA